MNESKLWGYTKSALLGAGLEGDATRHEDRLSVGTPDVSFCVGGLSGWIELKALDKWPPAGTFVQIDNLQPWQVNWIESRGEAGACISLLCAVGDVALLFPWWNVRAIYEGNNIRERFESLATWQCPARRMVHYGGLVRALASCIRLPE